MTEFDSQITIVGGGIAGLWLLNRLCLAGYDAILLDKGGLGSGQTLASQGIIHGGLKYALNGILD
ncbi:MAG: FAD-dependent oxidoreductase, partial [Pseudohongiella nitratireducens]|nr:FAD-dependent oxidoreductase [Pseudohongiella nitratireducens]